MSGTTSSEKLRSTCDNCALSKVRCNKKKPVCQRCEAQDLECVYGRSQRRGKPRAAQHHHHQQQQRQRDQPLHSPYSWCSTDPFDVMNTFPDLRTTLPDAAMFDATSMWPEYSPPYPGLDLDSSSTDDVRTVNSEPAGKDVSPMPDVQPTTTTSNSSVLLSFAALDKPCTGDTCTSTVFCTLGTLCHMGAASVGGIPQRGDVVDSTTTCRISSDLILKTNRMAIQRLQQLLAGDCAACARDVNLGLLLCAAVSKIMEWYRAVLHGLAAGGGPVSSSSTAAAAVVRNIHGAVAMTPITMGDFQLDLASETRMKAQLLLCELQNVGPLVDALALRNAGDGGRQERGTAGGAYAALDGHLRAALGELTAEIDGLVVSSSSASASASSAASSS
ncbi:Aflatoxin biosynthesis regulatory protein [Lasiodiplodia hormozganensis]|uniref:Aflatoxin biosynthesis regulatory protein n=1 Tax=Lasiodiplodia hormozganensis TaxID=869390 RepID=A0AA39XU37_9PEZI|nr:Aflatoxin biosynthesis regulatory protein [Lasiodiplodia hormozganensis]